MAAIGKFADQRGHAVEINSVLFSVSRPRFLKSTGLLGRGDPESIERQDHRANADVSLYAPANMPTPDTSEQASFSPY
jgi:hypothetical protein